MYTDRETMAKNEADSPNATPPQSDELAEVVDGLTKPVPAAKPPEPARQVLPRESIRFNLD